MTKPRRLSWLALAAFDLGIATWLLSSSGPGQWLMALGGSALIAIGIFAAGMALIPWGDQP